MNAIASGRFSWHQVSAVAAKELRERLRNRWVLVVAALFGVFAVTIAWFGSAQQGMVGFRSVEVTVASLVSLVIYLIPLIALILGFDAIAGERERGSLDLLLSLPITRLELLLGKFMGLALALALATTAGFGLVGLLLARSVTPTAMLHYGGFMASSLLLGLTFLSIALLVSVTAKDRTRASGTAIGLWFLFVLVFDLLLLGGLVAGGGDLAGRLLPYMLLFNPADVYRILNIFGMEDLRSLYGLATVFPESLASPWLLGGVMLAWIAVPLGLAAWRFNR